ncbi:MAG: hypothetical protein IT306_07695 [Chloroflexi bacterium]|nr:hypothetical protein [Chloroflexota bacterium]
MLPVSRGLGLFVLRLMLAAIAIGAVAGPFQVAFGQDADPDQPISYADWPDHDWRSPGFVGVIDGVMYDPDCWPLQAVGANVPNLIYRESIVQNLEWMRRNKVRWIRVFATGHREAPDLDADAHARMVRELTSLVEAYNKSVGRSESIYLLIVLTDYYGHGIPGDKYLRDNPAGCDFYVLPAPWFRRGYQRFNFNPECGDAPVSDVPNYEVNYKPWVRQLVSDLAESPAIMGWQLGNELKARNNVRNGVETGYDWYLDFVKDMTDTIRSVDKNHLVFVGAQYFAELTDIPYRPGTGGIDSYLRQKYLKAADQMARACGAYCWNVWPLTFYDFNAYPADDAMVLHRGGVATLATEYGFTLGTPSEDQARFGGSRVAALRAGIKRPWQDINGEWHDAQWGLAEAIRELEMNGAAPWGSPYPNPDTDLGSDLDRRRGISLAPEGMELWQVWTGVAADLEYQNARTGLTNACTSVSSSGRQSGGAPATRPTPVPPLMARPSASPTAPLDITGVVTGISTSVDDPTLIITTTKKATYRLRMPRNQSVKTFNVGDNVRARGWPMGDGVMLATGVEVVYNKR